MLAPIAGVPTSSSTSIEFHDKTTTDTRCAALEDTCIIGNSASSLGRRRINRGIRARLPWGVAAMHCSRTVSGLVSIAALTTEMPWVVLGVDPSSHRPSPRGRLFAALCRRTRQALLASQGGFRQPLKIASLCIFWEDLDSLRHCASVPSSALLKHARARSRGQPCSKSAKTVPFMRATLDLHSIRTVSLGSQAQLFQAAAETRLLFVAAPSLISRPTLATTKPTKIRIARRLPALGPCAPAPLPSHHYFSAASPLRRPVASPESSCRNGRHGATQREALSL